MKGYFVVMLAMSFVGCEQTGPALVNEAPERSPAVQQAVASIEFARKPDARMVELRTSVEAATASMIRVANTAADWQDAHALAQREISEAAPGHVRASVEQAVAKVMLVGFLTPHSGDPEAASLALQYARLLVERESPEAQAVLGAVEAFESTWAPDARKEVALGAAEAVEAHVREGSSCRDCELPADLRRALTERGQTTDIVTLQRLETADRLRALAG